jgi:hypothetical protein
MRGEESGEDFFGVFVGGKYWDVRNIGICGILGYAVCGMPGYAEYHGISGILGYAEYWGHPVPSFRGNMEGIYSWNMVLRRCLVYNGCV